jgi:hypothetical protein
MTVMGKPQDEHGEGNYKASRDYDEATRRFVRSGKVDEAARNAEPTSDADALEMAAAEAEGKRRAKEEDPALARKARKTRQSEPGTPDKEDSTTAPETPRAPRPGEDDE